MKYDSDGLHPFIICYVNVAIKARLPKHLTLCFQRGDCIQVLPRASVIINSYSLYKYWQHFGTIQFLIVLELFGHDSIHSCSLCSSWWAFAVDSCALFSSQFGGI